MSTSIEPKLPISRGRHALVIGGSLAGLLAARVLTDYFDWVTVVERDRFPDQPAPRQGVPQSKHVHLLLTRGQRILEELFPGLEAELMVAGAPTIDWIADWSMLGVWGWEPRFPSKLIGRTCSRNLLEWLIRRRLADKNNLEFLEETQVTQLLTDSNKSRVTGVRLHSRKEAEKAKTSSSGELAAELVVDASGRNSSMPKWLASLGYQPPCETVVDSFMGYASRWYQLKESREIDWRGLTVMYKPPDMPRGGILYPVEGNRCVVTLAGVCRDYPPTDEVGFLEFARTLRSPILYEVLLEAQPISPIYGYRGTENRLRHYKNLSKLLEGLVVMGDAVCAFNPVYGQGMTVAALGALTLDECLHQQLKNSNSSLMGLTQRFQKRLAGVYSTPWVMATGEDFRWNTTTGGQPDTMTRFMQRYVDQVLRLSVDRPKVYETFEEVVHMLKSPKALFSPSILAQVLLQVISGIFNNHSPMKT